MIHMRPAIVSMGVCDESISNAAVRPEWKSDLLRFTFVRNPLDAALSRESHTSGAYDLTPCFVSRERFFGCLRLDKDGPTSDARRSSPSLRHHLFLHQLG